MKTKLALTAIVATVVVLAVWLKPFSSPQAPEFGALHAGPVVAKIGGAPIYLDQVQSRYSSLASIHGADVKTSQLKGEILDSFVQEVAIAKGAADQGVAITPPELALYIAGVTSEFQNDPKKLAEFLKASRATMPQLEARVFLNFLASRLYLTITRDVTVSDQEIKAYYAKHRRDFDVPAASTPQVAFEAVKPGIMTDLLKQKRDEAWASWLGQQTHKYTLDVVMEDWWNQIERAPQPLPGPGQAPTPSASPSAG